MFLIFQMKGCESNNTTSMVVMNLTGNQVIYEMVYNQFYRYGLPIICAAGFIGNVLNLIILAGKRIQHALRRVERASNMGLIALAVADLSFCVCAFPTTFLPQDNVHQTKGFLVYYSCYCAAIINIFILTSTWLTVTMATERYLAICHPLRSRWIITLPRTKACTVLVYIIATFFNLPVFWRYTIIERQCDNETTYTTEQVVLINDTVDHAYRAVWAVFGNFVPLLLLLICNIGLMREIHKSYAMRKQMNGNAGITSHSASDQETNHRITVTLVAIVVMFLILVAPSEIMKHLAYLFYGNLNHNYTYLTIEIITNLMQTINFSANFILYCIINPSFRRTMKEMLCFQYQRVQLQETMINDETYSGVTKIRLTSLRNTRGNTTSPRIEFKPSRITDSPQSQRAGYNPTDARNWNRDKLMQFETMPSLTAVHSQHVQ